MNATAVDLKALPQRAGHSAALGPPRRRAGPLVTDQPWNETIYLSAHW
jgi:hypothetical protein